MIKFLLASTLLLAGCGATDNNANQRNNSTYPNKGMYAGPVGSAEKNLNVLVWPGYAEDGTTDPLIDWVTPFEKNSGCDVSVKTFNTPQEAINLMQAGGYDVISAPSETTFTLIENNTVQPINTYLLENYSDLFDDLKERSWNKVEENIYGVAQGRGVNLLGYNINNLSNQVINWDQTFNSSSKFAGRISVQDTPMSIAIAALYLMKANPDLEITNPYALDLNQFNAVMELVVKQKSMVANYWTDYFSDLNAIKNSQVDIGLSWQSTINAANTEQKLVGGVKPIEGTTGWVNTWMISNVTNSINCSYMWIDWMTSPQTNALTAEWFGEAPANRNACTLTADKTYCSLFNAQDDKFWSDIYYWEYPRTQCLDGRTEIQCVGYEDWFLSWTNFRNS